MIEYSTLKILKNEELDENIYSLKFKCKDLKNIKAGQFILLDCITKKLRDNNSIVTLLKRPFSIYKADNKNCKYEIIYKVSGIGTDLLTNLKLGDECYFLGPLGKPVDIENYCNGYKTIYLIAGGMGIAPVTFLAQHLVNKYYVNVLFGVYKYGKFAKKCIEDLNNIVGDSIYVSSEIKTRKKSVHSGDIVDLFDRMNHSNIIVFTCGPEIMMERIHNVCINNGMNCYVFTERRMACGIGVCHSCNINGYTVCKDGPCFKSTEVFK